MSHKKDRVIWQHKFTLSSDNPDHVRLHERLLELAKEDQASSQMITTLVRILVQEWSPGSTASYASVQIPQDEELDPATKFVLETQRRIPVRKDDKSYGLNPNPNDILRQRKAAAREKLNGEDK